MSEGKLRLKAGQKNIVDCNWENNEAVIEPEHVLNGLTGISMGSAPILEDFPNGTCRQYVDFLASVVFPTNDKDDIDSVTFTPLRRLENVDI